MALIYAEINYLQTAAKVSRTQQEHSHLDVPVKTTVCARGQKTWNTFAVSYIESKITVPKISYPTISLRYDIRYIAKYSELLTEILHKNINKIFQLYIFNVH